MKKLVVIVFAMCAIGLLSAQTLERKNGISFKALLMDYQSQNGGALDAIRDYHYGFEIGYQRVLKEKLFLNVPFKFGNVNTASRDTMFGVHKRVAGIDAQVHYHFNNPTAKLSYYALAGAGGVTEVFDNFNVQVPIGLGLKAKLSENAYFNIQSEYRWSNLAGRKNLHHGLGFVYYIGKPKVEDKTEELPDSDGDGIVDKLDLCPDVAGLAQFNGCPDGDGDGVPDYQDKCPKIPGLKNLMGCPDTDGDGISDNEDECPNVKGTLANKGCPEKPNDRDNDGVPDNIDRCPDVAGPASNDGCPEKKVSNDRDGDGVPDNVDKCPDAPGPKAYNGCPDTDGDGLDDSIDKCPNTPGPVVSMGCPEIKQEDRKTLDIAMRAVQFETGKAALKQESYAILKQISSILDRYPDYNLMISGHTDNIGSATANQDLSEKRAKACLEYLVIQGMSRARLSSIGYGESRPVSNNETEVGRTLNRRVEFTLVPR